MRSNSPDSGSVNIIGAGTSIDGDIISTGDIRIDGTLKGTVKTRGKLVIGPSGSVEGEVNCQNADISGNIRGKVNVSDLLALKSTAKLNGEISTGKLAIEPGADFSGSCSMGGVVKEILQHDNSEAELAEKTA
ncbi:MAG: polymer-forming cytoskeletal protein [Bacteroidetes bacterium]|nr:polymer-forming cytoskeletal protein [Bacteroidota bacterium]